MANDLLQIEGFDEIDRLLKQLPGKVARRVGRKAIRAGAAPVRKAARALVPIDEGDLKRSITTKVKLYPRAQSSVAIVGSRYKKLANGKNPGNYSHLVEFGHVLAKVRGGPAYGIVSARPFLRPAFDSTKGVALLRMAEKFRTEIAKEVAKLRVT